MEYDVHRLRNNTISRPVGLTNIYVFGRVFSHLAMHDNVVPRKITRTLLDNIRIHSDMDGSVFESIPRWREGIENLVKTPSA